MQFYENECGNRLEVNTIEMNGDFARLCGVFYSNAIFRLALHYPLELRTSGLETRFFILHVCNKEVEVEKVSANTTQN